VRIWSIIFAKLQDFDNCYFDGGVLELPLPELPDPELPDPELPLP
jgi:hypothetical protein